MVFISIARMLGQNVGINSNGSLPDQSAGLDVNFSNKGMLIPRVSLTSAVDNATIPNPAHSLLVFNTGLGGLTPEGFYYNAGTPSSPQWIQLLTFSSAPSTNGAWLVNGNLGTNSTNNFIGTVDSVDWVIKTNAVERARVKADGRVSIGSPTVNGNAIFQVSSPNKGVLFPKVALSSIIDNTTIPVSSPNDDGLIVYNTITSGSGNNQIVPGYYYWQNNRWNRFMSNAYSGAVFGTLCTTTPNHLTAPFPNSWQYTKAYIDIPPGKWIVFAFLLMVPGTYYGGIITSWSGSCGFYCRLSLSTSSTSFSVASDIVGGPFIGGVLLPPSYQSSTSGAIVINNNSSGVVRYYLWGQILKYNASYCTTPYSLLNFATNVWGENQFFAIPAN